jgi:hypothetical protein
VAKTVFPLPLGLGLATAIAPPVAEMVTLEPEQIAVEPEAVAVGVLGSVFTVTVTGLLLADVQPLLIAFTV